VSYGGSHEHKLHEMNIENTKHSHCGPLQGKL